MLVQASAVWGVALAVHVIFVIVALGYVAIWPLLALSAERKDPRAVPALFRRRVTLSRSFVNPGLLVVLAAGIVATANHHLWKQFYVQWGIAAVVVLGGLEGALVVRQSKQLVTLSERDVAAAPAGGVVSWSVEYSTLRTRVGQIGALMALIVIATVVIMIVK